MTALRKGAALLLAALICFGLGGCGILPSEEYNDYDVSGYIQALLDSSYHNSHKALVAITQEEEGSAMANYTTTVENAAINFCNAYSLELSDEQMGRLEDVMAKVLLNARYQVKDEVKTGKTAGGTVKKTAAGRMAAGRSLPPPPSPRPRPGAPPSSMWKARWNCARRRPMTSGSTARIPSLSWT